MKNEAIRQTIAHHMDGLRLPEGTSRAVLQKVKEEKPMKRRISLVVAAVIVLVLAAATALAVSCPPTANTGISPTPHSRAI